MSHKLQITEAGSFMKDRTITDAHGNETTSKQRRYRFQVYGDKETVALYRKDLEAGFPGGAVDTEHGLVFYSWDPQYFDTMGIVRGREREGDEYGRWFMDLAELDHINKLAERAPHAMAAFGTALVDRMFPTKKKVVKYTSPVEEQERNLDE